MSLKTENSRRVAESRPVCMGLKGPYRPDAIRHCDANFQFSMTFKLTLLFFYVFQIFGTT